MKTVHTLSALKDRADYSGRTALDSSGSRADTALQKKILFTLILMITMIAVS